MAAKNKLSDLRDHLFLMLEELGDPENKHDEQILKRAHAVTEVAGAIIDTAKVEVDMVKALANSALDLSPFFDGNKDRLLEAPKDSSGGGSGLRPPLRIADSRR